MPKLTQSQQLVAQSPDGLVTVAAGQVPVIALQGDSIAQEISMGVNFLRAGAPCVQYLWEKTPHGMCEIAAWARDALSILELPVERLVLRIDSPDGDVPNVQETFRAVVMTLVDEMKEGD